MNPLNLQELIYNIPPPLPSTPKVPLRASWDVPLVVDIMHPGLKGYDLKKNNDIVFSNRYVITWMFHQIFMYSDKVILAAD